MKYQVTYHLLHAQYNPTVSVVVLDAHTHAELDMKLAKVVTKWQVRGYTVRIEKVTQRCDVEANRRK